MRQYRVAEFAALVGTSVRTLRHYDRLGLLKPSGYSTAGYRLYGERDIARLQQIATLKLVGFPLKQIKELLDGNPLDLPRALRLQRRVVEEQRRRLGAAVEAIERAERLLEAGDEPDWETFAKILEVMSMQNDWEWVKQYYTAERLEQLAQRPITPERQAQVEREWAELARDVEAALGEDPAGEKAQALAARWSALIEAFTDGDPGIEASLNRFYADRANWPAEAQARMPFNPEVGAFIEKALAARRARGGR